MKGYAEKLAIAKEVSDLDYYEFLCAYDGTVEEKERALVKDIEDNPWETIAEILRTYNELYNVFLDTAEQLEEYTHREVMKGERR